MRTVRFASRKILSLSSNRLLNIVDLLMVAVLSDLVSSIVDHDLVVTFLHYAVVWVVNSFIIEWVVCYWVVFVLAVLYVLEVSLKIIWLRGDVLLQFLYFGICVSQSVLSSLQISFNIGIFLHFKIIYTLCS